MIADDTSTKVAALAELLRAVRAYDLAVGKTEEDAGWRSTNSISRLLAIGGPATGVLLADAYRAGELEAKDAKFMSTEYVAWRVAD